MISKLMTITDDMTEIPVMVTVVADCRDLSEQLVFQRAGYGTGPSSNHILLTDLIAPRTERDPFQWKDGTMRAAHFLLKEMGAMAIADHTGPLDVREYRRKMWAPGDGS